MKKVISRMQCYFVEVVLPWDKCYESGKSISEKKVEGGA